MASYEAYLGVGIDASGAQAGANQFAGATNKVAEAARKAEQAAAKFKQQIDNAAMALKFFATAAAGLAIREIVNYTQALSNARAMTNATAADMARLSDITRELGASTVFSAGQVADAAAELGKAGFSVDNIIKTLPATLDLAAAATIGIAQAADITAGVMAGFGIAAEDSAKAADILAVVATSAKTDITGLGEALKYVGPVAKSVGWNLEETTAILGVLANQGIEGSMAGTALKSTISSLVSPTKAASEALKGLGLSVDDVRPGLVRSDEIFKKLAKSGIDAERAFQIFGDRGAVGVLAVTSALQDLDKMTGVIQKHEGASRRMAEIKLDNVAGDWEKLTGALSETAMVLGSAGIEGALRGLLQTGAQWVDWLNKMVDGIFKNKEQAALLVDVLGAVAFSVSGIIALNMVLWLTNAATAFYAVATAATAMNAAILGIGGVVLGALAYLVKLRLEIIDLEKYTRKQEDALLDMAGATGEAARQAEIAALQIRRAQMRSTDSIVGDIVAMQKELDGVGAGYLMQNQSMLDQKRIKSEQLAQLQKELSMVDDLKKKEDELVVKKITTSRAYQQNAESARVAGLAAMGLQTGNVTATPSIPGMPPTNTSPIGGSKSTAMPDKSFFAPIGGMSSASKEFEDTSKAAWGARDAIVSTSQEFEKYNQKNRELTSTLFESYEQELLRNSLIKEYGGDLTKINLEMAILNEQKKLDIYATQQQQDEVRQLVTLTKEQQDANKQATDAAQKATESQRQWNNQLTSAFKDAIMNSKNLGDALSNLANRVQDMLVNKALDSLLGNFMGGFAKGAAFSGGGVTTFASGGVVNSPTTFPMRGGMGLMGEAGAEAIMPLTRTSNGDLGVKAIGGGGTAVNNYININVSGGTKEQNDDAGRKVSAAVKQAIDDSVISVILREKRPGGVLNAA